MEQMERRLILDRTSPENQPQSIRPDQQGRALAETLEAVRGLRDTHLQEDSNSHAGLLLGQIGLVLQRFQHGIPSGRETFGSLLRAAGLSEEKAVGRLRGAA